MQTARREFLLGLLAGSTALGSNWLGNRRIEAAEVAALDAAGQECARFFVVSNYIKLIIMKRTI